MQRVTCKMINTSIFQIFKKRQHVKDSFRENLKTYVILNFRAKKCSTNSLPI